MPGPHRSVSAARNAVAALDLPAGARVVAGISGGADSLALAAALAFVAPRKGWVACAVVVDHQLREDSADDAARAVALCRDLGLEAETVRVAVAPGPAGPEGEARTARMAALLARAEGGHVLLGHTLDDQAETVLLGLARGSGTRSLAGMAPAQERILRPLLGLTRADTEAVCAALGLTPIEDPSNALDGPWRRADGGPLLRSAVRHTVLPVMERELGPRIAHALARTAALARADADALDAIAQAALADARRDGGTNGEIRLAVGVLDRMHEAVRTRVLNRAIIEAGGTELTAAHTWAVARLVTDYHGQGAADLPGFVTAEREGADLVIRRRT